MPSAIPRNSENEPRVTMSAGRFKRAISSAFKPPPAHPNKTAMTAQAMSGRCASRHIAPKVTAARPIIEPTDRSMPPVTSTGVSATASRPSSTLNRSTSKKLPAVRKFSAMTENTTASARSAAMSAHLAAGKTRTAAPSRPACGNTCILLRMCTNGINNDGYQNDSALNRPFPIRAHPQKRQPRSDLSQQHDTKRGACDGSNASRDSRSANDNCSDDLHLKTDSGVAGNLIEPDGIENGSESREQARQCKNGKHHSWNVETRKARSFRVRSGGIDCAAGRRMAQSA